MPNVTLPAGLRRLLVLALDLVLSVGVGYVCSMIGDELGVAPVLSWPIMLLGSTFAMLALVIGVPPGTKKGRQP